MLVAPVLRLMGEALSSDAGQALGMAPGNLAGSAWLQPWLDPYLRWRLLWSALQAALTCGVVLLLGVPVAWVLARLEFVGRRWVLRALMLPFVVPTLVAAMGVLALWGPQGLWVRAGGAALQDTPFLLLYGNVFFNLCVLVRSATDALEQVSAARLAAARTLGATPWRAFWRIEWPAILPWLMSALCLVFLYCFAGFGLALVLGGQQYATVEVEIYTLVAYELQLGAAGVLALWTLAITGVCALLYAVLERRLATPLRADRVPRRVPQSMGQWLAVAGALAVLVLFCLAPIAAIVLRAALAGAQSWAVLWEPDTLQALRNTLRFSGAALLLATVLGLCHALAARHSAALRALAFLPLVVSPVLVAFGLLLLYPGWTASVPLLIAAYALLAYPFVAKSVASGLDGLPANLLAAARSLGASPWRAFWRVTWPLLLPALRRGMAFAAATAVGEFAVTLFLSRPEWATLSTLIYQHLGRPGAAHLDAALVLACALMALALAAFLLIEWPGAGPANAKEPHV
ncbi:MAG: iron ABC transporter permease [Betaproteobacteria bacterium]